MKIACVSDTHTLWNKVETPEADVLIHAGDLNCYFPESLESFCNWLDRQPQKHKIVIAGNHDKLLYQQNSLGRKILKGHCHYLEDSGIEIGGIKFWGSPYTLMFYNWFFMAHKGIEIQEHWDLIPSDVDVLITHGPPYGVLDEVCYANGDLKIHTGCPQLLEKIKEVKPKYNIFGHIHEAYGIKKQGETTFVNCSLVDEHYNLVNNVVVIDMPE